ncbi:MAG: alpha-amylase, partial [Gammaproteobacteria bacterium]|nr:alpha-amylase [Gammaproteobacteria bacterium]
QQKPGDQAFFMTAEAYNYPITDGLLFKMDGGTRINYYAHGFDSMINFGFKRDAEQNYETLFSSYLNHLQYELKGFSVLNYISSHDDGSPFDLHRTRSFEAATKLMLSLGAAQIYYGDEIARPLQFDGVQGDANLRSMMPWQVLDKRQTIQSSTSHETYQDLLKHWQKLGQFRYDHVAVGAGLHQQLSVKPYVFKRSYSDGEVTDIVLVALDLPKEKKRRISVKDVFKEGDKLKDHYSGRTLVVKDGMVTVTGQYRIALLSKLLGK